jgi:hypothetical protein
MKSRLDLGFVAQPRNRPPTSSCCSCHHAARTRPRWPPGPSNEAYLSSTHLEASPATTFCACSSLARTRVKPQPAPAILNQESVHTTLSITHHTRKRASTGPRTTHGPHQPNKHTNWRLVSPIARWCHSLPLPGPTSPAVSLPPPPGASAHAATTPTTVMTPSPRRAHLFKPAAPPRAGAPSSSAAITAVAPNPPSTRSWSHPTTQAPPLGPP